MSKKLGFKNIKGTITYNLYAGKKKIAKARTWVTKGGQVKSKIIRKYR